jgi:hypothetical protein
MTQEVQSKRLARAAELKLKTSRKAPPGDALSHNTAGYAKIMCSAIFITGLSPEFAAENVGYFTAPYSERAKVGKPIIDYHKKSVSIMLPDGVTRTAIYTGSQGCVCLPEGFTKFVSTLAEPWVADGLPVYGGLFWINCDSGFPIPEDAYMMRGAGEQSVTIIPSHDLVIVRLGHFK